MEIRRARYAGACYGVKRALRLVEEAIQRSNRPVNTLGPLIHNPQVVEGLRALGIETVNSIDEVDHGTIVIRSHGVSPTIITAAQAKGLKVLDATCPHVSKAQAAASELNRQGYTVVVVGERGHPEVEGISGYAGDQVLVVQNPDELPAFDAMARIGVVAQTTQTADALASIIATINSQGVKPEVYDTICFATRQRQEAASELAAEVDVMLVVGGRNSSNTTRLTELCRAVCPSTYHLEKPAELDASWFVNAHFIGITAGASTPESQIEAVESQLYGLFTEQD
ncbi:MAG: 4-hydroxy-3-methylbut-2-enyl diphosphate reductase [Coriobacteriales bacterium]|jgi:4-hydroxy-3-methylbut-2-enyl diphosphate reductase|nr:4-hydroxy-3-methylbut-2-enyl diphosphate reductase [Coriobacteriales bacterium]